MAEQDSVTASPLVKEGRGGPMLNALSAKGAGVPGKAMLLLPVALRGKKNAEKLLELNSKLIPAHSSFVSDLSDRLPHELSNPSFNIGSRDGSLPFANDLVLKDSTNALRDLTFITKPGAVDPRTRTGAIFIDGDAFTHGAFTPGRRIQAPYTRETVRQRLEEPAQLLNTDTQKEPVVFSFEDYLKDPRVQAKESHYAELKAYGGVPLNPEHFAGALVHPGVASPELLKALRAKNLPYATADHLSSEAMWDAANWLQQKALK